MRKNVRQECVGKRSRVASEAQRWVVWRKASQSNAPRLSAFEQWLMADRENGSAYMRARQGWSRWDRLALLLSQNPDAVAEKLATLRRKRIAARIHRDVLWMVLSICVLALLLT